MCPFFWGSIILPIATLSYSFMSESSKSKETESTIIRQCATRIDRQDISRRDTLSSYKRLRKFEFLDQQALNQLRRCRALLEALEQPDADQNLPAILKELRDLTIDVDSDD